MRIILNSFDDIVNIEPMDISVDFYDYVQYKGFADIEVSSPKNKTISIDVLNTSFSKSPLQEKPG